MRAMDVLLDLARDLPRREVAPGASLLTEGMDPVPLFVLVEGALEIQKRGTAIAVLRDPGACIGEMSLLLGVPATADVVAIEPTVVAIIEDAPTRLLEDPAIGIALARRLATRLQHMTTYLADLQHQYADHEGGLGMVGSVLGSLMHQPGKRSELGSDRDPDPEY
jgi:CRP/FNR family cyclic AMP-dependent transcriptional regulator